MDSTLQSALSNQDFDFDLATLALKGKRFAEAQDRFTKLAASSGSVESWCGLGFAKFGMVLDDTTLEEVFYYFDKAKLLNQERQKEVEGIMLRASNEVILNLYKLYTEAVFLAQKANKERGRAMVATAIGVFTTINAQSSNRNVSAVMNAGFAALSYDRYLKANSSIADLERIARTALETIKEIEKCLERSVTIEVEELSGMKKMLSKYHTDVIEFTRSDEEKQRLQLEEEQKVAEQRQHEDIVKDYPALSDPNHEFYAHKRAALRCKGSKKYREALVEAEKALSWYPYDKELNKLKQDAKGFFAHKIFVDIMIFILPLGTLGALLGSVIKNDNVGVCIGLIAIVPIVMWRNKKRQGK